MGDIISECATFVRAARTNVVTCTMLKMRSPPLRQQSYVRTQYGTGTGTGSTGARRFLTTAREENLTPATSPIAARRADERFAWSARRESGLCRTQIRDWDQHHCKSKMQLSCRQKRNTFFLLSTLTLLSLSPFLAFAEEEAAAVTDGNDASAATPPALPVTDDNKNPNDGAPPGSDEGPLRDSDFLHFEHFIAQNSTMKCWSDDHVTPFSKQVRGTCLGGWMVLEPWITPSLFYQFLGGSEQNTATDMYSFCTVLGPDEANKQLKRHWEVWVTEDIITELATEGKVNSLRLPVGDWMFAPYGQFVFFYL